MSDLKSGTDLASYGVVEPSSRRFDSIYAEAANEIIMSGFDEEHTGEADTDSYYALVRCSRVSLMNLAVEGQLYLDYVKACEIDKFSSDMDLWIIQHVNSQGFITAFLVTDLQSTAEETWGFIETGDFESLYK